jgi:hypothetical protein
MQPMEELDQYKNLLNLNLIQFYMLEKFSPSKGTSKVIKINQKIGTANLNL